MEESYTSIAELGDDNQFPSILSKYQASFNNLFKVSVCDEFLKGIRKMDCNEELFNTGLETISTYILENSKKVLNSFTVLRKTEQAAKRLLNSADMKKLGTIIFL